MAQLAILKEYNFARSFLLGDLTSMCVPGAESVVELMLNGGVPADKCVDPGVFFRSTTWLPISVCVARGSVDILRMLIAHGARIDVVDDKLNTPLHIAAFCGQHQIVRVLLDLGADPHALNARGFTALDRAAGDDDPAHMVKFERTLAVGMLFDAMNVPSAGRWNKWSIAVRCGRDSTVADLIAADAASARNQWLVELALEYKHIRVFRLLMAAGCVVSETALCRAVESSLLLEPLLGPVAKGSLVLTSTGPLLTAIKRSDEDAISLLLAAGSPVNADAAIVAAEYAQYNTILKLIVAGLDVEDWKPIYSAFEYNLVITIQLPEDIPETPEPEHVDESQRWRNVLNDAVGLAGAQQHILRAGLPLIRARAFEICVGLRGRALDALCVTVILEASLPLATNCPFHIMWNIATAVKHFRSRDS